MRKLTLRTLIALPLLSFTFAGFALAADTTPMAIESAKFDDFAAGKKAISASNWTVAVDSFKKAVAENPKNADAHNLLGYSYRMLGKFDDSFAAYDKALALDPKHKGALNYSGMGYLKTNQKAKAEAQLAKLKVICPSCSETTSLAKAVADFKPDVVTSTY